MSLPKNKRDEMCEIIIDQVHDIRRKGIINVSGIAKSFGVTTKSVYAAIRKLEKEDRIVKHKVGRKNNYKLARKTLCLLYELLGLEESEVFGKAVSPFIGDVSTTVFRNFEYAFTEILNNAIDHSNGTSVEIIIAKTERSIEFTITDNGVGIFKKITEALQLDDERHAVLELSKGKFTTDPKSHSGEGIFFSSKAGDFFFISSGEISFCVRNYAENPNLSQIIFERESTVCGTVVTFEIDLSHSETVSEVFNKFTLAPDDYGFTKTLIPVKLLQQGGENVAFISRSQAKRLLSRVEKFVNVMLDFEGVDEIGQAFADEIFRVFQNAHPHVNFAAVHCNDRVRAMINRAKHHRN